MSNSEFDPPESPATWENVVAGKAKEAIGHVVGGEALVEEGKAQEEIAHELREQYDAEHGR